MKNLLGAQVRLWVQEQPGEVLPRYQTREQSSLSREAGGDEGKPRDGGERRGRKMVKKRREEKRREEKRREEKRREEKRREEKRGEEKRREEKRKKKKREREREREREGRVFVVFVVRRERAACRSVRNPVSDNSEV
jgi:hypothetical protein